MKRYQQTKHALGSDVILTLVVAGDLQPQELFDDLWQTIDAFEQRFSRFLTTSELTRFNHGAGARQQVSAPFHDILLAARQQASRTDGLYNPLILPALQHAGYKGSWPTPEAVVKSLDYSERKTAPWDAIQIGDTWAEIPEDTALDFGGIGKGYLLDELGLKLQTLPGYWLSLGGDILCAGTDAVGQQWSVGVQSALQTDQSVMTLIVRDASMAIATSGTTKRKGTSKEGSWHHLIDPRTGKPASTDIATATVCTRHATDADILAKCLVLVGSDQAERFIRDHSIDNALWQTEDGTLKKVGTLWSTP